MKYEIDFLPVGEGSGDAIVIRYGDDERGYFLHVVDGGRTATADTIAKHIDRYYPGYHIDHMVLSHADDDHATGLVGVLEKFEVRHLWMNRPWLYAAQIIENFHGNWSLPGLIEEIKERHPYLVDLERIANMKGTVIHEVFQGDRIGEFTVLAPTRERYINSIHEFGKTPTSYATEASGLGGMWKAVKDAAKKLFEDWDFETLAENSKTSASNESCVVQYAVLNGKGVLLTADVGPIGLAEAGEYGAQLGLIRPKFVQMPHHGSRHNVTPSVLDMWLGPKVKQGNQVGTAYCSVGANKDDYPRAQVTNAFIRRGFKVYSTRTKPLSHSAGGGHGWGPATPEEFQTEVEGL